MHSVFKKRMRHRFFIDDITGKKKVGLYGMGGGEQGGGGQQTTQTVEKSDPWEGQQPYLQLGFKEAEKELWKTPSFYPGQTYVPFSPETNMAIDLQTQRALNGSPIQDAGTDQLTRTLSGDYLNNVPNLVYNNPYQSEINQNLITPTLRGDYLYGGDGFNAAYEAASNKIIPQVDSAFERSGRTGSGLAQQAKTSALSDAFASQYGQERQNQFAAGQLGQQTNQSMMDKMGQERETQMRAALFAPQMASLDYQDIGKLAEVGAEKESMSQQQLADQIARHDYEENARGSQLSKYLNYIQGNYGGQATGSSTSNLNGGGGGGGIGSSIGMLAPMLFGGFGGGGGILGALLGLGG